MASPMRFCFSPASLSSGSKGSTPILEEQGALLFTTCNVASYEFRFADGIDEQLQGRIILALSEARPSPS